MAEIPTICQEKSKNTVLEDVLAGPNRYQAKSGKFPWVQSFSA
jgi:hypothetical protein